MLKKIQSYLVLHYPVLWNTRFVPALIVGILLNLFFFCLGFIQTDIVFSSYYYVYDQPVLYTLSVISGILLFIYWLSRYTKNNAFRTFYPKKPLALYFEWLLTIVIIFLFAFFSYSVRLGSHTKLKMQASKEEVVDALNTLNMVAVLIPESEGLYFMSSPDRGEYMSEHVTLEEAMSDTLPESTFADYPSFTYVSLLNYSAYSEIYNDHGVEFKGTPEVLQWLKDEKKEEIEALMDDFLQLHVKHGLSTNLTREKWMELIYHPNKYPINKQNLIKRYNYQSYSYELPSSLYYVQFRELLGTYKAMFDVNYFDIGKDFLLIFLSYVAVVLSIFVLAFRVTSGRAWLIAIVAIGLFGIIDLFATFLFQVFLPYNDPGHLLVYVSMLLLLFVVELLYIFYKIQTRASKGRSQVVICHIIGFLPALLFTLVSDLFCFGNHLYA